METNEPGEMEAAEGKVRGGKARRRVAAKAPTPEVAKRSLNLRIDQDSYQRLNVHALMRSTTVSALVEEFARDHLREYVVHRRSVGGSDGQV
jgi:hypothetical protein